MPKGFAWGSPTVSDIEGVEELKAALAEVSNEVATKVGRAATRTGATFMQERIKDKAPYADQDKHVHLRDQINVRLARALKETTITYSVGIGNAFWGYFSEYGTKHEPARPWMRPAFDSYAPYAIGIIISGLADGVERAAIKAAKGRK